MTNPGPFPIKEIENVWIPMSDGCRLAAKLWIPKDASNHPVPAILEYIPYRKRDYKAVRDAMIHRFFARHGYGCVRVDLRGSGDSEGILKDEYLARELEDGLELLRWIAAQPWCNGNVGMFGLSWGGFNGLQIAALQPPELKAVITVCSSDDRYQDDVHYMGGCLLTDNLSWASTMFAYNSCPPDPRIVGDRWRGIWLDRLENSGLWLKTWLEHQTRDAYWRHASVCEDYSAIRCPVFAVSGWADGYSNSVFRLMAHLQVPRRGLVGAWNHKYPNIGGPGPAIAFLSESVRWWDRWLKGIDTGVDAEPMLRVWMQDASSPLQPYRPGRWVAETSWPSPHVNPQTFHLSPGRLLSSGPDRRKEAMTLQSPLSVGLFAGKWCSYAESTDLPYDQREEDGGALVFDTPPLAEPLEILGPPLALLELSADKPVAMVAARLSLVAPNQTVTRVTYGLLNLTHQESHESPKALEPHHRYSVQVRLNHVAQRFPAGYRIRLAISSSYWPLAWPSPESPRLTLYTEGSQLQLPVRPPQPMDNTLSDLGEADGDAPLPTTLLAPALREWKVIHNLATNEVSLEVVNNESRYRIETHDLALQKDVFERYRYLNNNYDTVQGEVISTRGLQRGPGGVHTVTRTLLSSTRTHFRIRATLDAFEDETRVFAKSWDEQIRRFMV